MKNMPVAGPGKPPHEVSSVLTELTVDGAGDEKVRVMHVGFPPGGEGGGLQLPCSGQAAGERLDLPGTAHTFIPHKGKRER